MKKKKIIFFHPYSVFGGADLSISKLIESVPDEFDIDFITLSKNPKIKFYTNRKIKIIKINKRKTILSLIEIRNFLKKELLNYNKIIFLSNQNFANLIALVSSFNLKKVKNISFERNHLSELNYGENIFIFLKNQIIKILIKFLYRYSDIIVGNSSELCDDLRIFTGCKVTKLQNFYDFQNIKNMSLKKIEKKIKFKNNIILNIGRLTNQKNQIHLLKAFKIVNKNNKNINLLLIGNGNKKNILMNYIKKNNLSNNVQILNNINNSLPYIRHSDLYVSTSIYEGFPNVLLESVVLNLPIISTYFKSGLSEILLYGKGGLIVKSNNPKNLSNKIIYYFANKNYLKKRAVIAKRKSGKFNFEFGKKKFQKIIYSLQD